jgi:hypothetical protein
VTLAWLIAAPAGSMNVAYRPKARTMRSSVP